MKKLNLLLTLVLAITLFSCGSDDDGTPQPVEITEANLIGTWQWTSETENGVIVALSECDLMDTIEYKMDNIATHISHDQGSDGCISFSFDSAWSLDGNLISYDAGDADETILELTNTTLSVTYIDEDDAGTTYIYVDTYTKI